MASISGRIQAVIHSSDGFYILVFTVLEADPPVDEEVAKVKGYLHGLSQARVGVSLKLDGRWVKHAKYGRQFSVRSWDLWAASEADIERFLRTCVDGFLDSSVVQAVCRPFGMSTFEVMTREPDKLLDAVDPQLRPQVEGALRGWARLVSFRDMTVLLHDDGLGASAINNILGTFGSDAGRIIREDPYRLMDVPGLVFDVVDKIGRNLGVSGTDDRRLAGVILHVLRDQAQRGHLYLRRGDLPMACQKAAFPESTPADAAYPRAIELLEARKAVRVVPDVGVYLSDLYTYERDSAQMIRDRLTPLDIDVDIDSFVADYEKSSKIELSVDQRRAVERLRVSRVLVITGLPGTGKTLVVRTLVRLFEAAKMTFMLMAPTGIAAKRLSAVTGHDATTIHRAFKYNGTVWAQHRGNRVVVDAVVIDEMSMVDQELLFRALDALPPETVVVLVGDDEQLSSVGPGNVLRELVACPSVPHVRLTQIFRQSEAGDIVLNSHRISRGEMPVLQATDPESEFRFVPIQDETRAADLIVEMAAKLKSRNANFQVLSAKYAGTLGVDALNDRLRERLNPPIGQTEAQFGSMRVRVGDRLMVVQNDYDRGVYNGDMGKLVAIEDKEIRVRIHGAGQGGVDMEVRFPKEQVGNKLKLAYAVTVHKSQGNEFDTVILPMAKSHGWMLQRNLLYTAVTRARHKVWILGDAVAVQAAVANDKVLRRNTVFASLIEAPSQPPPGVVPVVEVSDAEQQPPAEEADRVRSRRGAAPSDPPATAASCEHPFRDPGGQGDRVVLDRGPEPER